MPIVKQKKQIKTNTGGAFWNRTTASIINPKAAIIPKKADLDILKSRKENIKIINSISGNVP
jgi:hypothetical protein